MKIAVPKQNQAGETRVALVPQVVKKLAGTGFQVLVQTGAGLQAGATDAAYTEAGATVVASPEEAAPALWTEADVVLTVAPPTLAQVQAMKAQATLVGVLAPMTNLDLVEALRQGQVTAFAMEFVPRISRSQSMDVLSSQANIGGYKAMVLAANHCRKMFPMMITAAGTLAPARVFVIGAGVAGLQAIATAKRLGAVVEAFDVRPATKEQVQSLGARFVELAVERGEAETAGGYAAEQSADQQRMQAELMAKHVIGADAVVTTAAVFGKAPPMLIPRTVVEQMTPGSVLVDIAADRQAGRGNCEATRPGETYRTDGDVTLIGTLNLPSLVPMHASLAFANNMQAFLKELAPKGELNLNFEDAILQGACITHAGEVRSEMVSEAMGSR